jgi:predicted Zn finger-like uncharacterized protein
MRLICPNCDAEYEVDASLVPPEGRDVQCSNCTNTWFQTRDALNDEPEPEIAQEASLTPKRPATDPEALDIIREEVAREARARASETAGLETQGDLGLIQPGRLPYSRPRPKKVDEDALIDIEIGLDDDPALTPAPQRGEGKKRELLPDIEEINSTLTAVPEPDPEDVDIDPSSAAASPRRGFRIGFGLMLMFCALILIVYARSPELADRFPQLGEPLMKFVSLMDRLRVMVDNGAQALLKQLTALTDRVGNS